MIQPGFVAVVVAGLGATLWNCRRAGLPGRIVLMGAAAHGVAAAAFFGVSHRGGARRYGCADGRS